MVNTANLERLSRKDKAVARMREINDRAKKEQRELTKVEQDEFDKLAAGARRIQDADSASERALLAGHPAEFAETVALAVENGTKDAATATSEIFNRMVEGEDKNMQTLNRPSGVGVARDFREGLVERMAEAVACRYTGKAPSDGAREFVGASIADLAKELLQAHGVQYTTRQAGEVIRLAGMQTISDFPNLLQSTGQRILLQAYQASSPAIKQVARPSTAADFRTKSLLRLGEAPTLLEVNESGEIHSGSRTESKESYRIRTYARIFSISRQALINDDLSAFADSGAAYGRSASVLEGTLLTDLLTSNPAMQDTIALFHASHANLVTSNPLSVNGLSAARLSLRTQTGLDGTTILDLPPATLLVPAALETAAEQYLAAIFAAVSTNVNPFAGKLALAVDPRLDANSATSWYLFADSAVAPVLEYSHLAGQAGLFIESRLGFEVDGFEIKCRLDYGVGAIGFRGAVKNTA